MKFIEASAIAALIASPAVVFLACGSSDSVTPPATKSDAGDAGAATDAPDPNMEAGADAEQPPDTYPSMHEPIPQLTFLNGKVLDHMKVVTVTFAKAGTPSDGGVADAATGGDGGTIEGGADAATPPGKCTPAPNGDSSCAALRTFDDFIIKSDWWHQVMGGYKISDGTSLGYAELDEAAVTGSITDMDIQTLIQTNIDNGLLPAPVDQILYTMYFPAATQIGGAGGSGVACVDFLGYHYSTYVEYGGKEIEVAYAVIPRCPTGSPQETRDQLTVTASHELAEAATDPYPVSEPGYRLVDNDAWVASLGAAGTAGDENGDVCIFATTYDESGYKVQPIWSNSAAAASHDPCEPAPTNVYYGAAVRTTLQEVDRHKSRGYLVMNKGDTLNAPVDFFSTEALPHDVMLYTGLDKGTGDPSDMGTIKDGITAVLSTTSAHNGNGFFMAVTVPPNAVSGDFKFLVRSVLDSSDYHDWPVIVHVN